ncbi:MAG: tryptophan halogenase [Phenylobacterium sp.]|jgi:tryptophan halogenase
MAVVKKIKSIVIVGGGTAGWMTAAALGKHFQGQSVEIKLVESSQLGTIGVGEATIPTLRRFYSKLGLSDIDVLKATNATCKLGIEFKDWHSKGKSFIHPFGLFGQHANEVPFHHYWLKLRQQGDMTDIANYSMGVSLAKNNKFIQPAPKPASPLAVFDWALHFDATLFADLMCKSALGNGVTTIDNTINKVNVHRNTGHIQSLSFENGESLAGDLFIDCSGFKALLIEGALKTGFEDWSEWLVCDKAIAVQSESTSEPLVRTISQAHDAGWQWKIPLQHRQGNGHVFCSKYISEDEATATLLNNIEGKTLHEPRSFSFTPGRRKLAWHKNCIAVGLSSGFLEPLESTSIALVETAIDKIVMSFAKPQYGQKEVDRFNEVTRLEYERVRDFIILHYKANQRQEGAMWQYCRDMVVPAELAEKMRLFKTEGKIVRYPWEIFGADSWLAIFSGMDYLPEVYDPRVDNMPLAYLSDTLAKMRSSIQSTVSSVPTHTEFLTKFCDYKGHL